MLQGLDTEPILANAGFMPCECIGITQASANDGGPEPPILELILVDATTLSSWELDDHTRQVGRQGIQLAREALRAATQRAAQ